MMRVCGLPPIVSLSILWTCEFSHMPVGASFALKIRSPPGYEPGLGSASSKSPSTFSPSVQSPELPMAGKLQSFCGLGHI